MNIVFVFLLSGGGHHTPLLKKWVVSRGTVHTDLNLLLHCVFIYSCMCVVLYPAPRFLTCVSCSTIVCFCSFFWQPFVGSFSIALY